MLHIRILSIQSSENLSSKPLTEYCSRALCLKVILKMRLEFFANLLSRTGKIHGPRTKYRKLRKLDIIIRRFYLDSISYSAFYLRVLLQSGY